MSARRLLLAIASVAAGLLAMAASAGAHQLYQYEFEKSFNGSGSTAGAFTTGIKGIAIDQADHHLYVLDNHPWFEICCSTPAYISQFNLSGEAVPFSGLAGVSSFEAGPNGAVDVVSDNTGHGGGFYAPGPYSGISNWNPNGTFKEEIPFGGQMYGLGFQNDGTLLVATVNGVELWDPFTNSRIPTSCCNESYLYEQSIQHIEVDSNGYVYGTKDFSGENAGLYKYFKGSENLGVCCRQGFVDVSTLRFNYAPTPYAALDRSDDDLFAVEGTEPGGQGVQVTQYTDLGQPITTFGLPEGPFTGLKGAKAVAVDSETHKVYVTNDNGSGQVAIFKRKPPVTVPDVATIPSGHPSKEAGVLKGTVNADGVKTTGCKFEWGTTTQYTEAPVTCEPGVEFEGSEDHTVEGGIAGLTPGTVYHYRVAAENANGHWSYSPDHVFEASLPPTVSPVVVDQINTDGARFGTVVDPEGGTTSYHFELGEEDCSTDFCTQLPAKPVQLPSRLTSEPVFQATTGLHPDTPYYIRAVAENEAGQATYLLRWRTYPSPPEKDLCANSHVRQQTGTTLLPDCRAYELVSAADAGGYEVESPLVPGQDPYPGYPSADGRVLYSLHDGALPGVAGEPPNYGRDPYVAERTETGWASRYVGLPGGSMADQDPYGSPVIGADEQLTDFAFGGDGICEPCFEGLGTNLPLRLDGGAPQPGMTGSKAVGDSSPEADVAKYLSADGSHLVFGSKEEFEFDGAGETPRIYERDLKAGTTRIVSTDEAGATLTGSVAELDLSADGSRALVGERVSKTAGDTYWQLYMHVGDADRTVKLTQGAPDGAIFDGMTADGSKVFFTTSDPLAGDTDNSADIYEVEIDAGGSATAPRLVSVDSDGSPSNSDACTPSGAPDTWNAAAGNGKCGAVAFADGAGVASGNGTLYFVSPEQLDGSAGTAGEANLYVVAPEATPHPRFVATIDSSLANPSSTVDDPAVLHGAREADTRRTSDFQVSPDGRYAAFDSLLSLTGFLNLGHYEIYRWDGQSEAVECASCATTNSAATKDTLLTSGGLNLSDDGRVFFTSPESLVLTDTNGVDDAYEWSGGLSVGRLSTGAGVTASELLTASADGTDAYFFTRSTLVPEDRNGSAIKIYDAREGGGFPQSPEPQPCAAADECHGPGTTAPPPPNINSLPESQVPVGSTPKPCKKGFVRRHGKCVKKHRAHRRHHRHRGGGKR